MENERMVYDWSLHTPEELGIPSEQVSRMLQYFRKRELNLHSLILMRHGKVVAETYVEPFKVDTLQRLYSSTKSFAAIATLLLCDEGKLSLSDPLIRFFPEVDPEKVHPWTRRATIHDALTMQLCFPDSAYSMMKDGEWIQDFFRAQPDHPAGLLFYYDTAAAQMLAEIVKRLTGKPFHHYLRDKIGVEGYLENAECVCAPDGSEFAGSGLRCTTRSFALTAQLMCGGGVLMGQRFLSEKLAKEAVSPQSVNNIQGNSTMSTQGYGYQIWCGEDCFMFKGMATQYAICYPRYDLTLVVNSNTRGDGAAYEIVYSALDRFIIENLHDRPLPECPEKARELQILLTHQPAILQSGRKHSPIEKEVASVWWDLTGKIEGIHALKLEFEAEEGILYYENDGGPHRIHFGYGERRPFEFREQYTESRFIGKPPVESFLCYGTGTWTKDNQLRIKLEFEGIFMGHMELNLGFREAEMAIYVHHDIDFFADLWFLNRYKGYDGGKRRDIR